MESPILVPLSTIDRHHLNSDDPFLLKYQPYELRVASEFFSTWLPFLSRDLCPHCIQILSDRIRSIGPESNGDPPSDQLGQNSNVADSNDIRSHETTENHRDSFDAKSTGSGKDEEETNHSVEVYGTSESQLVSGTSATEVACDCDSPSLENSTSRMSWADLTQEDEFENEENKDFSPSVRVRTPQKPQLSRERREHIRFMNIRRKKDFACFERVKGKLVNILHGLELHEGIFSAAEQIRVVDYVTLLQEMGKNGEQQDRTYSAPHKWMRGKGRQTMQFGCCYNYAVDKDGNPPGILPKVTVDPLPDIFKVMIRRLIRWRVLPPTCVPDSCIVNIYDEGDCIPPHIDNHDFVRPFCTVSFLSECNILFGSNLRVVGPGEFDGSFAIPLPVGSVLVLNGNGADVAKHCVPAVPSKRISITFRKMDVSKRPVGYVAEADLRGIQPLAYEVDREKRSDEAKANGYAKRHGRTRQSGMRGNYSYWEPRESRSSTGPANRWGRVR